MSELADRFVVLLDANVLYPFRVRDALLRFCEAGLYRARWSQGVIDEWTSKLLSEKPHLKHSIDSQLAAMTKAFPEAMVEGYEGLIPSLKLPDPNDRHVLAAAIRCGAQHIATENLRDFPSEYLCRFDIEPVSADQFLASTFELYPMQALAALRVMRRAYAHPAMNPSEFLFDLTRCGLVQTATLARQDMDAL